VFLEQEKLGKTISGLNVSCMHPLVFVVLTLHSRKYKASLESLGLFVNVRIIIDFLRAWFQFVNSLNKIMVDGYLKKKLLVVI